MGEFPSQALADVLNHFVANALGLCMYVAPREMVGVALPSFPLRRLSFLFRVPLMPAYARHEIVAGDRVGLCHCLLRQPRHVSLLGVFLDLPEELLPFPIRTKVSCMDSKEFMQLNWAPCRSSTV